MFSPILYSGKLVNHGTAGPGVSERQDGGEVGEPGGRESLV